MNKNISKNMKSNCILEKCQKSHKIEWIECHGCGWLHTLCCIFYCSICLNEKDVERENLIDSKLKKLNQDHALHVKDIGFELEKLMKENQVNILVCLILI